MGKSEEEIARSIDWKIHYSSRIQIETAELAIW
jgi:hypothetical protein